MLLFLLHIRIILPNCYIGTIIVNYQCHVFRFEKNMARDKKKVQRLSAGESRLLSIQIIRMLSQYYASWIFTPWCSKFMLINAVN